MRNITQGASLAISMLVTALAPPATHAAIELAAVSGSVRVRPDATVSGELAARIECARGETESFQVVVTAAGQPLRGVEARCGPLAREDGATLPPDGITLYRPIPVWVRHSSPRATEPPGLIPDPLVPLTDPYTGEPVLDPAWRENRLIGSRAGGARFELWENHQAAFWVDVRVDAATPAGTYRGALWVESRNAPAAELPVEVVVWDFVLPPGPSLENHFGGFERVARYHGIEPQSDTFQKLEERYIAMMAEHRLNPPLPARLRPSVADDGSAIFSPELDAALGDFVGRHHLTNIEVPHAPFADALGADRDRAMRHYRSWYAYLERKGWTAGAYLYVLDEPNDAAAYQRVRELGRLVAEAEPRLRRLVVEQPYVQDPAWGTLDGAIDIWCPLFGFVHEPSIRRVAGQGDAVWSYSALVQPAPGYHPEYEAVKDDNPPYWQIDFPVTSYRIAPWLNRRYGITGLLYWSTVYWGSPERNPWQDPGFRVRWNGDGFLFYPGSEAGIEGPIASIRLKNLRDGMEDYEYFELLDGLGGGGAVDEVVRAAVPTWGSWQDDPGQLTELRRRLAAEILRRSTAQPEP